MRAATSTGMRDTFVLVILTACYLIFELGFNARLLDVVGGTATPDQVESIEKYGRTLSGIAVALVVLQLSLALRRRALENNKKAQGIISILVLCALTVILVYSGIRIWVDHLVETRTHEFRRLSLNLVLVQRSLVEGKAELGALDGGREVLAKPEGKAFLALFPLMALSVAQLDEKIHDVKFALLEDEIDRRIGGEAAFYAGPYKTALTEVGKQWETYSRQPVNVDAEVAKKQDSAWRDYTNRLSRRNWTPDNVPGYARKRVVQDVRRSVRVPRNWDPADEETFRRAVKRNVLNSLGRDSSGGIRYKGHSIRSGLSFNQFVLQKPIQRELKEKLDLPTRVTVRADYPDSAKFRSDLYLPMLKDRTAKELAKYEAPSEDFRDGGPYAQQGKEAARSAIVPPIALFFSLLGAIGHSGKLLYLFVKLMSHFFHRLKKDALSQRVERAAKPILFATLAGGLLTLSVLGNGVTASKLYVYMIKQMSQVPAEASFMEKVWITAGSNIMHVVTVGQGFGYPINEHIRKEWLQGFNYGYVPASH